MNKDQLIKYVTNRDDANYIYGGENYVIDIEDMRQLLDGKILNFDVNMEYGCTLELSEDLRNKLSAQPCEDCIKKQDEVRKAYDNGVKRGMIRPKGEWRPIYQGDEIIDYRCTKCDFSSTFGRRTYRFNFCPNCGADMRGEK